jgi:ubiquinone/menaquinone biosynthesis C-methylase UbiE
MAASVVDIPFKNDTFELVVCFEVLEHIPFDFFQQALIELHRVAQKNVILSLPDFNRAYYVQFQIPRYGAIKKLIKIPRLKKVKHIFDGEHYWEIGKDGYPLRKIEDIITKSGFYINKTFRLVEDPSYRFFILSKVLNQEL